MVALAVSGMAMIGCAPSNSTPTAGVDLSAVGKTATGANLKCASSGKNAWDTYGGAAFLAVNASIFTNVTNEITAHGTANLGMAFTLIGSDVPTSTQDNLVTFQGNLAAFLVYLYGGPTFLNYNVGTMGSPILVTITGPQGMQDAHMGLAITPAQYTYFVTSIVVPALTSNGVPSGDVSSCFAPPLLDSTFQAAIVGQ